MHTLTRLNHILPNGWFKFSRTDFFLFVRFCFSEFLTNQIPPVRSPLICTGHGSYVTRRRYLHPKQSWTPDAAAGRTMYPGRDGSGSSSAPSSLLSMAMTCPMVGRLARSDCTQRSATCTHRSASRAACSCPSTPKSPSTTSLPLFSVQCCHTCTRMTTVTNLSL